MPADLQTNGSASNDDRSASSDISWSAHAMAAYPLTLRSLATASLALLLCAPLPSLAQDAAAYPRTIDLDGQSLRLERVATGLVHPWAIALLPDGRALVTERNDGHVRLVSRDGQLSAPIEGVPAIFRFADPNGQGGLLDVKLHPDFARNREIFLSYSRPTDRGAAVAITRARLMEQGGALRLDQPREIFVMKPDDQDSGGLHFGGRMALDRDGQHLFLAIGDRRNMNRAQKHSDQAGSILRMTLDGKAATPAAWPAEQDDEGETKAADPFIHAKGSRNSQALAVDPGTGALWSAEHGPKGGDRVDSIRAGANLGWPLYTAGVDYSGAAIGQKQAPDGIQAASHVFEDTVAPSGAAFYTGKAIRGLSDRLLIGGLANESLVRIELADGAVRGADMIDIGRRVRDVRVATDGSVWMVTDHADGEVLRLVPAG